MNSEFHYYLTYAMLIAAGWDVKNAEITAYASQYIDDNVAQLVVDKGLDSEYTNYISQTKNIFLPRKDLRRIFPVFHFLPGMDDKIRSFYTPFKLDRRNTEMRTWIRMLCKPNSTFAKEVLVDALESLCPYRIGLAIHSYTDTWAHQNFIGAFTEVNRTPGIFGYLVPWLGHAGVKHAPDLVDAKWKDKRLTFEYDEIDNRERFFQAAFHLWDILIRNRKKAPGEEEFLRDNLKTCLTLKKPKDRIMGYKKLAKSFQKESQLPDYNKYTWFNAAIKEDVVGPIRRLWYGVELFKDQYHWKDSENYMETDWYKFQQAVKKQQHRTLELMNKWGIQPEVFVPNW